MLLEFSSSASEQSCWHFTEKQQKVLNKISDTSVLARLPVHKRSPLYKGHRLKVMELRRGGGKWPEVFTILLKQKNSHWIMISVFPNQQTDWGRWCLPFIILFLHVLFLWKREKRTDGTEFSNLSKHLEWKDYLNKEVHNFQMDFLENCCSICFCFFNQNSQDFCLNGWHPDIVGLQICTYCVQKCLHLLAYQALSSNRSNYFIRSLSQESITLLGLLIICINYVTTCDLFQNKYLSKKYV